MISWILIASYLWKDTWKLWFEQPGSILARIVVTSIMVAISIILLVAFSIQVDKVREQLKSFGVDSMLIVEMISPDDLNKGVVGARFGEIAKWGSLLTVKNLYPKGKTSEGDWVSVISYGEDAILPLSYYLDYGSGEVLLTNKYPEGMIIDVEVVNRWIRAKCLKPREEEARVMQGQTLLVPSSQYSVLEDTGYSVTYFLERHQDGPSIEMITESIRNVVANDKRGKIEIKSAAVFKQELDKLEKQQLIMRYTMAALLGGALALIYGTLSVLEFRQQRYVAALMRSFGVPRFLLALRNLLESVLIVNGVAFGVIFALRELHNEIFKALRLQNDNFDLNLLYFSPEILWVLGFVNLGVILSSIPTLRAMSKPVGKVLN
jgi:hypothetical protein